MNDNATLCLHIPVAISLGTRTLHGELALPAHASEVRVCIGHEDDRAAQRREARKYAEREIAALNLVSGSTMTSGDILKVIDWVRSRRLLQPLPISLLAPSAQARAALKAAHHRPASVSGVIVKRTDAPKPRNRVRHLTLAYSA
ncbi:MAG TPA: hypothetical protein VJP85_12165 [Candidatus Baltobacteraceae bacterium]|nr:hypothetical protein [Candidatus Baltobacteraceae bacterium]